MNNSFLLTISQDAQSFRRREDSLPHRSGLSSSRTASFVPRHSNIKRLASAVLPFLFLPILTFAQTSFLPSTPPSSASPYTAVATPHITLTAYSVDGTNSGTARLARNVTVLPSTPGVPGSTFLWSLNGPGTLSATGVYTAPAIMPANRTAIVTATLSSDAAVSASYQMTLTYAIPTIRWMQPSSLMAGKTNAVTVVGYDFTPATTILVGGVAVPGAFQSPNEVIAQIPVKSGTTQPLSIEAANPTPGGGHSVATQAAIQPASVVITAYSSDGENSGTARLGHTVSIQAGVAGLSNPTFLWTVSGGGTITALGVYTAPAAMPSSGTATVTATLVSNTSVKSSYKMVLEYAVPSIRWLQPSKLASGITNAVTVVGYDFTPATTILVGGTAVPATLTAPGTVVAQIPVGATALTPLSIVAKNPTPGGGSSAASPATIQPLTIQLSSYNKTGLNPSTAPLGLDVQYIATVVGSGNPAQNWSIQWSVQGGGTISPTGLYQAPSVMPAGSTVTISASVASAPAINASAQLSLLNTVPVVNQSSPTTVTTGQTNTVTFTGQGFEPSTTILVGGTPIATTFLSSSAVAASIPVSASATTPLSITAQNPAPGGGTSIPFSLMLANSTTVSATIGTTPGLAIAGNFLGLSHDWNDAQSNMGTQAVGVNAIYRQLVQNLSNPGSPFFIRIGGGSTDGSVAPTATTVQAFVDLAKAMPVHFSLGVNLGANDVQLAEQQASFFASQMPAGSIEAIEIGNEPDRYSVNGYRPSTYTLANYLTDFGNWQNGIQPLLPSTTKVMGAAWATPWYMMQNFSTLEQEQAGNVSIVSQHFYAGDQNGTNTYPPDYLLKDSVSTSYVSGLKNAAALAHQNNQIFRVGELNSIDNGGLAGVSNTFTAALWSIDTMFEYANAGVDGVNFHGMSGCNYCAFTFGIQSVGGKRVYTLQQVNALYYGLLFFHEATTNSAQLLPVTLSSAPNVKVWATVDKAGNAHVAILNKDENFAGTVAVTLQGYGEASVTRLVAPSYQSTAGISLGDQTFDGSLDGNLVGSRTSETLNPTDSVYEVTVQPTSAVLLTLPTP